MISVCILQSNMGKMNNYLIEQQGKNDKNLDRDMEFFRSEHEAGYHKNEKISLCEVCFEEGNKKGFFATAGSDALRGLSLCTSMEVQEDNRNNPFD